MELADKIFAGFFCFLYVGSLIWMYYEGKRGTGW